MDLIKTQFIKYIVAGTLNYEQEFEVFDSFEEAHSYMTNLYNQEIHNAYLKWGDNEGLEEDIERGDIIVEPKSVYIYDTGEGPLDITIHTVQFGLN